MTVQDIFNRVRVLFDEWTDDGTLLADDEVADLQSKAIVLTNMAQKELYDVGNVYKTYEFTQRAHRNLLGGFQIYEFDGDDYITGEVEGAKAYYFEVDGEGTVEIQHFTTTWEVLETIVVPSTVESFTAYSGLISTSNRVRIRFTGTYYYSIRNVCLYDKPFKVVPKYERYVTYEMPSDFRRVDEIIMEPSGRYYENPSYKWEGVRNLLIDHAFDGNVRVKYKPIPTDVTLITDTLEIDDISAEAITYYVAARLAPFENTSLVNFFEDKYNALVFTIKKPTPSVFQPIHNVYGVI